MNRTDQTLLEQMQITDVEIARRKELLGFGDHDAELLMSCLDLVTDNIDLIVGEFYVQQTSVEEIALLIGDADTLRRLHQVQHAYILGLFDGHYDIEYVNNRLRIGMVHKRIGVEPKLYLAAVKSLKHIIHGVLQEHIGDKEHLAQVVTALDKLFYFDTTLIFDTYIRSLISEVESAKDKVLSYAKELQEKVAERTKQLQELSQRDPLTGIYNRRSLGDFLRRELLVAKRHGQPMSLAYFDIDDFKSINDSKGHYAGDDILRTVGRLLLKHAREIDFPCRYGGDEFCLATPECSSEDAEKVVQRLISEFSLVVPGVTFSIGIVQTGPREFFSADELLNRADQKMYKSKAVPGFHVSI